MLNSKKALGKIGENVNFENGVKYEKCQNEEKMTKNLHFSVIFLVDDQGLETDLRGQKWFFFKEKTAKIARFESHAPIMPQNAPV